MSVYIEGYIDIPNTYTARAELGGEINNARVVNNMEPPPLYMLLGHLEIYMDYLPTSVTKLGTAAGGNSQCLVKSSPYAGPSAGAEVARLRKWQVWCLRAKHAQD